MSRRWRKVLPPLHITAALCTVYLLTYLMDLYIIRLGIPVPEGIGRIRIPILVLASALYGFYRVRVFHPFYNSKYWQWLCLSPWSIDKPLPQGPVHLIWVDVVILAVLTLCAYSNIPFFTAVPVVLSFSFFSPRLRFIHLRTCTSRVWCLSSYMLCVVLVSTGLSKTSPGIPNTGKVTL